MPHYHDFVAVVLRATLQLEGLGVEGDCRHIDGAHVLESAAGCGVQQRETHHRPVGQPALSVITAVHGPRDPRDHAFLFRCDAAVHSGYAYERRNPSKNNTNHINYDKHE